MASFSWMKYAIILIYQVSIPLANSHFYESIFSKILFFIQRIQTDIFDRNTDLSSWSKFGVSKNMPFKLKSFEPFLGL